MPTKKYKFERDNLNQNGFMSKNTAGTDAEAALSHWLSIQSQRKYEISEDSDISITAELTWDDADSNAGLDLNKFCEEFGLYRSVQDEI